MPIPAQDPKPSDPAFVGREAELARLATLLERALGGELSVAFVTGEAGVGKSALVHAFARRAQSAHADLLYAIGECNAQTGIGEPYLPFREVLRLLTGDTAGKLAQGAITRENARRLERFLRSSGRVLAEFGPALADVLLPGSELVAKVGARMARRFGWGGKLRRAAASETLPNGIDQEHIFEQYTGVLRRLSGEKPLLLVLDDLQWVDAASSALFFHLCRRVTESRILILGTYRRAELDVGRGGERHPLATMLPEVKRLFGDVWVDLDAVGEPEARRVVDQLVEMQPNRLDTAFRERLFQHTRGHPLFTIEVLRTLRERGELERDADGRWALRGEVDWSLLPPRVEGVIEARVGRLPDELQRLLTAAAVEGVEFTAEVAARVERVPDRETLRALSGELDRRHHLVGARGTATGAGGSRLSLYRFRHSLFQTYLYGRLDPVERARLHEEVGTALEDLHAGESEGDDVAAPLARHFLEAGLVEKAVGYLVAAGERARRLHASEEAARHFREALARLPAVRHAERRAGWALALHENLGEVLDLAGRHEEARESLERALAQSQPRDGVRRARLHRRLGASYQNQHRTEEALREYGAALAELEPARAEGRGDEAGWWAEWVEVQLTRLWTTYFARAPAELDALIAEVAPAVERWGTPPQRARLLQRMVQAAYRREAYDLSAETVELARRALAAARETGDALLLVEAHFGLGFALLWHGERAAAIGPLEESLDLAERTGYALYRLLTLTYLATARRLRGEVEATGALASRALEEAEVQGVGTYQAVARANLAWCAWRAGERDRALEGARAAAGLLADGATRYPFWWICLLPRLAVMPGEEAATREEAARAAARMLAPDQHRLPSELRDALSVLLRTSEAGDPVAQRAALQRAVAAARTSGHL